MTQEEKAAQSKDALSFSTFVSVHEEGALHAELTAKMQEIGEKLNEAAMARGGIPTAELTVKFKFAMDGGSVDVISDVKATMPKIKRQRSTYFVDERNRFTRKNPKQSELPLRDVSSDTIRDAG